MIVTNSNTFLAEFGTAFIGMRFAQRFAERPEVVGPFSCVVSCVLGVGADVVVMFDGSVLKVQGR